MFTAPALQRPFSQFLSKNLGIYAGSMDERRDVCGVRREISYSMLMVPSFCAKEIFRTPYTSRTTSNAPIWRSVGVMRQRRTISTVVMVLFAYLVIFLFLTQQTLVAGRSIFSLLILGTAETRVWSLLHTATGDAGTLANGASAIA